MAAVAILILLPLVAVAVFVARFDPNAYKPKIAAAVERMTGRRLALEGPVSLGISLVPTITAAKVALANPPGFSRPEMATLARLDAKVALLPLLSGRIEIRRLILVRPDIAIEINRAGKSNLSFAPAVRAVAAGALPPTQPAPAAARPVAIDVRAFDIRDGRVSWQDDRSGRHGVLLLRSFSATADSAGEPLVIAANAAYSGVPFTLAGTTGPLSRLTTAAAGPPWPVRLTLAAGAARVSLVGAFADPAAGRGYRLKVKASLPALNELARVLPGMNLPALQGLVASAELADAGHGLPAVSNLSFAAGASNLAELRPGLLLTGLSLAAPRLDQPCKLTLSGSLSGAPFSVVATLGPPAALLPAGFAPPPPAAPWPIAIRASAAGADLSLSGTMARPAAFAGANLAVSAQIPDLAKLAPFAGRGLPALSQITFSGQIADPETGWRQWVRLTAFSLSLPQGDLSGDATLALAGPRPVLSGALTAKRLDLDALRATFAVPAPTRLGALAAPAAPAARGPARLIPDTPLPFAILNTFDADLTFGVGSLKAGGASYGNIVGKLLLRDGRLALAPFGADAPGGHVALTASVDAARTPPPVAITLDAPALALAPLLATFGLPARASGTVAVRAALSGAGNTPHAIAAGLNGRFGVAMVGGSVDNRVIGDLLGSVLRAARAPQELLGNGTSEVRCLALRVDAAQGMGTVNAGLLEMTRLTLTAGGSLALGPETLALNLDPTLQYGSNALSLPVHVGGTFVAPFVAPEAGATARSAAGLAGNLVSPQSQLGQLLGALRGNASGAAPACAPALALARFGEPGPAAPPAPQSAPAPAAPSGAPVAKPNNPLNLLRGLFH